MKIVNLLVESNELIVGTSCINCDFIKGEKHEKVTRDELNKNGGIDSTTKSDLAHAKKADLITMPGHKYPSEKVWCNNENVQQWVTERMCCNFWNAPGIIDYDTNK